MQSVNSFFYDRERLLLRSFVGLESSPLKMALEPSDMTPTFASISDSVGGKETEWESIASRIALTCSKLVPQQPPIILAPEFIAI